MSLNVDEQLPLLKKSRLSTGMSDLDIILEGGYQNPGNIIIVGPSGSEKSALSYHFAAATTQSECCMIICGSSSPADILNKAANYGINLNRNNIFFIDCYSNTLGKAAEPNERILTVSSPSSLNDLSLAINDITKLANGKKIRVIFDTLSTFVIYNPSDSIRKFLGVIEGRLRSANATVIYLVDDGVHDKQLLSLIEHGMDGVYQITETSGKFSLIIPEVDITIPIKLGPTGLSVV